MLLQERDHDLRYDHKMEEESKSYQLPEQRVSAVSVGFSDTSSCALISPPSSFSNGFRRSTFDLNSFNSMATSPSESSSYNSFSTGRVSSLRYRGQTLSSPPRVPLRNPEGAATQALLQMAQEKNMSAPVEETREDFGACTQSLNNMQGCGENSVPQTTASSAIAKSVASSDRIETINEYEESRTMHNFFEGILLGCLVLPLLHLTVRIEACARRLLNNLFTTLPASSASFHHQERIDFDSKALSSTLLRSSLQREAADDNDDACCYSSSSSSTDDDNLESDDDAWGHFADFQDELADESSFIPSCSASHVRTRPVMIPAVPPSSLANTLETLAENQDEDEDMGEEWSF